MPIFRSGLLLLYCTRCLRLVVILLLNNIWLLYLCVQPCYSTRTYTTLNQINIHWHWSLWSKDTNKSVLTLEVSFYWREISMLNNKTVPRNCPKMQFSPFVWCRTLLRCISTQHVKNNTNCYTTRKKNFYLFLVKGLPKMFFLKCIVLIHSDLTRCMKCGLNLRNNWAICYVADPIIHGKSFL